MNVKEQQMQQHKQFVFITCYGALSELMHHSGESCLQFSYTAGMTVHALRQIIIEQAQRDNCQECLHLLPKSAFATDEVILSEYDAVHAEQTLSLLPPVCGG